jgi:hypothetical protein
MTMTERDLDDLFAVVRAETVAPSEALLARIMADANAVADARVMPVQAASGFWPTMRASVGGWPVLGGMAAATLAGVWIGFSPPIGVGALATSFWGETTTISLFSSDDILGIEG